MIREIAIVSLMIIHTGNLRKQHFDSLLILKENRIQRDHVRP